MSRGGRLGGQGPGQYRNSPLNGFGGPMPSIQTKAEAECH